MTKDAAIGIIDDEMKTFEIATYKEAYYYLNRLFQKSKSKSSNMASYLDHAYYIMNH